MGWQPGFAGILLFGNIESVELACRQIWADVNEPLTVHEISVILGDTVADILEVPGPCTNVGNLSIFWKPIVRTDGWMNGIAQKISK